MNNEVEPPEEKIHLQIQPQEPQNEKIEDHDDWEKIEVDIKLLKEIDDLKQVVFKIHQLILIQNETIERLGGNVEHINHSLKKINGELDKMKREGVIQTRLSYIRDYVVPFFSMLSTFSPLIMVMGLRGFFYKYGTSFLLKSFVNM